MFGYPEVFDNAGGLKILLSPISLLSQLLKKNPKEIFQRPTPSTQTGQEQFGHISSALQAREI